jgi:hypothetical protein
MPAPLLWKNFGQNAFLGFEVLMNVMKNVNGIFAKTLHIKVPSSLTLSISVSKILFSLVSNGDHPDSYLKHLPGLF